MGSKNKKSKKNKEAAPKSEAGATESAQDSGHRHGSKKVITDSRFASVHSDPRFAKLTKHKSKVAIDSRFTRMFTDKSFSSSSAQIDKRGKLKKEASQHPLKHYYRLAENINEHKHIKEAEKEAVDEGIRSDEESEESEGQIEKDLKKLGRDSSVSQLKSEPEMSESEQSDLSNEDEDDKSSIDTTDSDEEDGIYSDEEDTLPLMGQEENIPEIDKETHRLAVVNLDWSHVKAVDLYVLLSSFLPREGQILSVAVYPSEFGLKRMEEEAVRGPVGLFEEEKEQNGSSDDDDDDDDEVDNEKLRAYELSRLRYYFAVVECDSVPTADHLYKTCDGVEFERSSNKLDLRFIPDSMEFKQPPRDTAREPPGKYDCVSFTTRALQQSKIDITWDEDEPQRVASLKRKFNADQLAELELEESLACDESETDEDEDASEDRPEKRPKKKLTKLELEEFLASDESETDEDEDASEDRPEKRQKKKNLYRSLLESGEGSDEHKKNGGQDMEVTFHTDLENISKRVLEKKDKNSETVWEAILRKQKEKKAARRNRSKNSTDDDSGDSDQEPREDVDDFFIEPPSVKGSKEGQRKSKSKSKGKKHDETSKEAEASTVELELLLADDKGEDASFKGYNMKPKSAKGERGKKKKEIPDERKIPAIDYDDPRFSALFTSHLYALDPTDPQFKRSAAYARQLAQKQRKGKQEELQLKEQANLPVQSEFASDDQQTNRNEYLQSDELSSKKEKYELSSLVRSIKMKSKQVQVPSDSKISRKNEKSRTKARW